MFLLLVPGIAVDVSTFLRSRDKALQPSQVEVEAANLSSMMQGQASLTLQALSIMSSQTLYDVAKTKEGGDKVKSLLQANYKGAAAYSGKVDYLEGKDGSLKIKKISENNVKLMASSILANKAYKQELANLKKSESKERITALEAKIKSDNSIGLYYTSIFQAKNLNQKAKAVKNLDSAIKALRTFNDTYKKRDMDEATKEYLQQNLVIIQALSSKSGTPLSQLALFTELKKLAERGEQANLIDELAKDLVTKAETEVAGAAGGDSASLKAPGNMTPQQQLAAANNPSHS